LILNIVWFVLGVICLQQQAVLPSFFWTYLLPPAAASYFLLGEGGRAARLFKGVYGAGLCIGAGFLWAALIGHVRLADRLPAEWEGRDIEVIGVVASLPQHNERAVRFEFDVEQVRTPLARVPRHISINWYTEKDRVPPAARSSGDDLG
jgi:competence protein ComEC